MKLKIVILVTNLLSYLLLPFALLRKKKGSVLHISYMVHIAYFTVKILREHGIKADYLAIGTKENRWKADYVFRPSYGLISAKERIREFLFFWSTISKYEIIHSHFMMTLTSSAWEMKFFRLLGGKWVVHGRGCAERNQQLNMKLHPQMNICQNCDYGGKYCNDPTNIYRQKLTRTKADHVLVTTPDMLDFLPSAEHMPFFVPPIATPEAKIQSDQNKAFKIIHVTNHPGIEGTEIIKKCIDNLIELGYDIEFIFLQNVDNLEVLNAYQQADLSIGKMKMGYYANAQIESLFFNVPAITYVRDEFITPKIQESGLILSSLEQLEETIKYYIDNPDKLAKKRQVSQSSVLQLHNNADIANRYKSVYNRITQ